MMFFSWKTLFFVIAILESSMMNRAAVITRARAESQKARVDVRIDFGKILEQTRENAHNYLEVFSEIYRMSAC